LRDAGDGRELFETRTLVVAAQGALGEKIHSEQDAHQESEKGKREFPE
jgi:hypothetical protein